MKEKRLIRKGIRRILSIVLCVAMCLSLMPAFTTQVKAEETNWVTLSTYADLFYFISNNTGLHHVKLGDNIYSYSKTSEEVITVNNGAEFVLDLNGYELRSNPTSIDKEMIKVKSGGKLTIINSSKDSSKLQFTNGKMTGISAINVEQGGHLELGAVSGCGPITIDAFGTTDICSLRCAGNCTIYSNVTMGSTSSVSHVKGDSTSMINFYGPTIYNGLETYGAGTIVAATIYGVTDTNKNLAMLLANNMIFDKSTMYIDDVASTLSYLSDSEHYVANKANKKIEVKHNEHSYSEKVVETEASMYQKGLIVQTCIICGNRLETEIPITRAGLECSYKYDNSTNTFIIQGTGATYDYTYDERSPWVDYTNSGMADAEMLIIEEGITRVGSYSFNLISVSFRQMESIEFPATLKTIGAGAFQYWENLNEINIPEGVEEIEIAAFVNCKNVENIVLPTTLKKLGNCAFGGIKNITSIYVPSGELGNILFEGDEKLETVTFGKGVTKLGYSIFMSCNNMKDVYFEGDAPEFDELTFKGSTLTVYYPENNATWTEDVRQNYYGTITWVPYCLHEKDDVTEINQVDSTCISYGVKSYFKCSCGKYFADLDCINEITDLETWKNGDGRIAKGDHVGGTATCTAKAKCSVCGEEYGSLAAHTYATKWSTDATNHWHACTVCGAKKDNAAHVDSDKNEKCDTCDYNMHSHSGTKVAQVDATCSSYGVKAYYKCSCGKYYSDSACTKEITDLAAWKSGDGRIEKKEHTLKTTTTKATLTANGKKETKCSVCGKVTKTETIYAAKTVKLSKTTYTYDGKAKKPTVTIKDSKGKAIATTNYSVKYDDGRKNVGKYNVKITFKGDYKGSKTLSFTINPKATTLKSVTPASKAFTAKWTKQTKQVDGYEVEYALDKNFTSSAKKVAVTKNTTTSKKISSLKAKKTYYVRVRTYKKVGTKKYYSDWSKVLSVKTK